MAVTSYPAWQWTVLVLGEVLMDKPSWPINIMTRANRSCAQSVVVMEVVAVDVLIHRCTLRDVFIIPGDG